LHRKEKEEIGRKGRRKEGKIKGRRGCRWDHEEICSSFSGLTL